MSQQKTRVKFVRVHGSYKTGDIAGFDGAALDRLMACTPCPIVLVDAKGKPIDAPEPAKKKAAPKKDTQSKVETPDPAKVEPGAPPVQGGGA